MVDPYMEDYYPRFQERWAAYLCPATGRVWFWCRELEEFFYQNDPPPSWTRHFYLHAPGHARPWWHNSDTGNMFWEDWAVYHAWRQQMRRVG